MSDRERPSGHGKLLGAALADIADAGDRLLPEAPLRCATCAFRRGCMTNQMAATLVDAMNIVMRVDDSEFACHHGLSNGEPTRLCGGYLAAMAAPFEAVRDRIAQVGADLDAASGPDDVRADADVWLAEVDPDERLDNYQLGRLYARRNAP